MVKKRTGSKRKRAKHTVNSDDKKSTKSTPQFAKAKAMPDEVSADGTQSLAETELGTLAGNIASIDAATGVIALSGVFLKFNPLLVAQAGKFRIGDGIAASGVFLEFNASANVWQLGIGDETKVPVSEQESMTKAIEPRVFTGIIKDILDPNESTLGAGVITPDTDQPEAEQFTKPIFKKGVKFGKDIGKNDLDGATAYANLFAAWKQASVAPGDFRVTFQLKKSGFRACDIQPIAE